MISHVDPFQKHTGPKISTYAGINGVELSGLMFLLNNELFRERFLFLKMANALPGQTGKGSTQGCVSSYLLGKG